MSGAFDTSSAAHPKQRQQKRHLFSQQPQQQHRTNNNRPKTVQKIVGGCETTESKTTRAGPINIPPTPGALTPNSEKDGNEGGCCSKQFFSKPPSLVNLEVNNYYPHSPFPTHSSPPFVQHSAHETVKGNNNWHDKTTAITTEESASQNCVVNNNGQSTPTENHHSNNRSQFYSSDQKSRTPNIPLGSRDQGLNAVTHLPSTSLATPLANHCIKEEVVESYKRSEQLPKGGEFAVPAVPARLKAATVAAVEPKTEEETRKEGRLFLEAKSKGRTSSVGGSQEGRLIKKESEEEREGGCEEEAAKEEPKPSTSSAGEAALTVNNTQPTPAKPFRLALRISAAAALKLRRIARTQARTLRRLGISSVQFGQQQFVGSSGYCPPPLPASLSISQLQIPSRTPSPEVARRETRQQKSLQQKQRLHHLAQQQLALVTQQFRGQSSTEIYSPNKVSPLHIVRSTARLQQAPSAAAVPTPTYPFHSPPVVHQSMDRQLQPGPSTVPITRAPMNSVIAENSPLLVDLLSSNVPPNQPQHNTVSQQQISLVAQQRFVANAQLQQASNQPALTPQQRQYQQHLYQQQQMHHQRVQQMQQQPQNTMLFGSGAVPAIAGQMHPHQTAIMVTGQQPSHPSFMMHPQMTHQQIRAHGTPSGGPSASSHGIVPMVASCGMPPPYSVLPQQQQSAVTISSAKANSHGVEVEEPPKKRKRISKKQQQKEEKEREQQQQQLRMQQEMALVQMQQRQQQQMYLQRQMAMQQQGMAPIASQGFVGTPQQNFQQHIVQYQQQQQYVTHNHQQQHGQPNLFNSPPHGNTASGHYTNQQSTPPQPSPQQYPMGAAQPTMHYMSPPGMWGASPQQQNVMDYQQQSQMTVAGQNAPHPMPTVTHMPPQQQQPQQQFRTPGTPGSVGGGALCYGHSPATTNCSASTPFHSPPPQQQQMVGTPSGGQHTPMGGGPTTPYGNSQGSAGNVQQTQQRGTPVGSGGSTVEHSRTNTPQQPFSLHSIQQHNAHSQSYQQGPSSHQSLQQMSPADFYQQQKKVLQQSPVTQQHHQQYHSSSTSASVFPQLTDFAEDGLVDDLVVPSISNEADDFDLDSIEPMRCGDHQQGYHHSQQQQQQQQHVIEETNHIEMSAEDKIAAEMEMLPDRSPQIDDKPLSPSKLSETQDRNVTEAIASVMERVAKDSSKKSRIKNVSHKTATN